VGGRLSEAMKGSEELGRCRDWMHVSCGPPLERGWWIARDNSSEYLYEAAAEDAAWPSRAREEPQRMKELTLHQLTQKSHKPLSISARLLHVTLKKMAFSFPRSGATCCPASSSHIMAASFSIHFAFGRVCDVLQLIGTPHPSSIELRN
jgi:hypothetical protein